jgi:cytochrome P450
MLLFPEVSQKIHEEIISVTDGTRLPRISDRASLPFTEAAWKESLRWNPFLPVVMPHVNSRDEVINGYTLKAGTLISQNLGSVV